MAHESQPKPALPVAAPDFSLSTDGTAVSANAAKRLSPRPPAQTVAQPQNGRTHGDTDEDESDDETTSVPLLPAYPVEWTSLMKSFADRLSRQIKHERILAMYFCWGDDADEEDMVCVIDSCGNKVQAPRFHVELNNAVEKSRIPIDIEMLKNPAWTGVVVDWFKKHNKTLHFPALIIKLPLDVVTEPATNVGGIKDEKKGLVSAAAVAAPVSAAPALQGQGYDAFFNGTAQGSVALKATGNAFFNGSAGGDVTVVAGGSVDVHAARIDGAANINNASGVRLRALHVRGPLHVTSIPHNTPPDVAKALERLLNS